jgi:hypothetical protein
MLLHVTSAVQMQTRVWAVIAVGISSNLPCLQGIIPVVIGCSFLSLDFSREGLYTNRDKKNMCIGS